MVNVSRFKAEFEAEFEKAASEVSNQVLKDLLTVTYTIIMTDWPKWTYYSMANNHVSLNTPVTSPTPSQRPTHRGAMSDDAAIKFNEGLQFIENLKPSKGRGRVVYISNPVPYASDPAIVDGAAIYESALNMAEGLAKASQLTGGRF